MTRDELLTKLATELTEWPKRRLQGAGVPNWGEWVFVHGLDEWHAEPFHDVDITEQDWMERREEMAATRHASEKWPDVGEHLERSKYHREIKPGVFVDVYDVLMAFGVTNPADAHAIKKMLMPGKRGSKDANQDRAEAIQSLRRAQELEQ